MTAYFVTLAVMKTVLAHGVLMNFQTRGSRSPDLLTRQRFGGPKIVIEKNELLQEGSERLV